MTTDETIFKFKNKYVSLRDLETWYSAGKVTRKDTIQIFDDKGECETHLIKSLIKLYGETYPFRRIPKPDDPLNEFSSDEEDSSDSSSDDDDDWNGSYGDYNGRDSWEPSSPPVGSVLDESKNSTGSTVSSEESSDPPRHRSNPSLDDSEDINFEYRDYPLYNVSNEPEEDRITGKEVVDEMRKLERMLPLKPWLSSDIDYFYFINRKNNRREGKSSVAICRLCNHTPFGGLLFFKHLFSPQHIRLLSSHQISRTSFTFWQNHIEKCRGITRPTVTSGTVPSSQRDLKPTVPVTTVTHSKAPNVDWKSIFPHIPLHFSGMSTEKPKLTENEIFHLKSSLKLFEMGGPKNTAFLGDFYNNFPFPSECETCDRSFSKVSEFTKHILSEEHLRKLSGITEKEYNFWKNFVDLEMELSLDVDVDRRFEILMYRNTRPLPLFDFKLESELVEKNLRYGKLEELREIYTEIDREKLSIPRSNACFHEDIACFACCFPKNHFKTQSELIDHLFTENHMKYLIQFGFSEKAVNWWIKLFKDIAKKTPVDTNSSPPIFVSDETSTVLPTVPPTPSNETARVSPVRMVAHVAPMIQTPFGSVYDPYNLLSDSPKTPVECNDPIPPNKEEKMEEEQKTRTVYQLNTPRVPLLDEMPVGEEAVSKERFNQVLDECIKVFESGKRTKMRQEAEKSVRNWNCSICSEWPKVTQTNNLFTAFNHITKKKHREKMNFKTCESDLQYWMNWVLQLKEKHKNSPALQKEPKAVKTKKTVTSVPRIPLLTARYQKSELSQSEYVHRYTKIAEELKFRGLSPETQLEMNCSCPHCPGNPEMKTIFEVMKHIFNSHHNVVVGYRGTDSDFEYYENLLLTMPVIIKKEKEESFCNLPLFTSITSSTGTPCIGPLKEQVEFISQIEYLKGMQQWQIPRFFAMTDPSKCKVCDIDMSESNVLQCVRHAFSVKHLDRLQSSGVQVCEKDFGFWIQMLSYNSSVVCPSTPDVSELYRMGRLERISNQGNMEVFENFNAEEVKMISKIDEDALDIHAESLFSRFGGCIYCDKWLFKPIDIINHYISNGHFERIRSDRTVRRADVDPIMEYIYVAQNDKKCVIT